LNLLVAALASLLLGVAAALVSDSMDTTVRDAEQTSRYLGVDVIGMLPSVKNANELAKSPTVKKDKALTSKEIEVANDYRRKGYYRTISGFEESIRTLRNTILLGDLNVRLRSLMVTSAGPSEGKSTVSVHIAIAHAGQGLKTLIVDGDLRRPSVARAFGMKPPSGLSDILTGKMAVNELLIPVPGRANLFILPAGPPSHRAADLIGPRMADLLDELTKDFDLVVLDSPPLLGFAEPLRMAAAADAVIVVSYAGQTKRKAVAGVLTALSRVHANVLGVVLNQIKRDTTADGYAYYGYYRPYYYRQYAQRSE
jgi:polysaccharide biosynthesis transport protein